MPLSVSVEPLGCIWRVTVCSVIGSGVSVVILLILGGDDNVENLRDFP